MGWIKLLNELAVSRYVNLKKMDDVKKTKDLTWYIYLIGILIAVLFVSSFYLDRVSRQTTSEFGKLSLTISEDEGQRIRDQADRLSEKTGTVSMIQQGVAVFLALPFG